MKRPRYRYSGVFIDILVAAVIFLVVAVFTLLSITPPSTAYILYCIVAAAFVVATVFLIGVPMLSRRAILPCVNHWAPRHIIGTLRLLLCLSTRTNQTLGCLLIGLPVGVAFFNIPLCTDTDPPNSLCVPPEAIHKRLVFSFVLLIAIYGHCNFSQLGAWPKTAQAVAVAAAFIVSNL